MTTYATAIGALSPGLLVLNQSTGVFSGLNSATSNQVLVSTGTNSYTFLPASNLPSPQSSTGIIQFALFNLGGAAFPSQTITTVGDSTSAYDAGAVVLSCEFTPYSETSTVTIEFFYTAQSMSGTITVNLYAIPSLLPAPFVYGVMSNNNGANIAAGCQGTFEVGNIDFTNSLNLSLCAFTTSGAGTQTGGSPFDYILVKEFANTTNPIQTARVTSTSATPVTLLTVDPTVGTPGVPGSTYLFGTVTFFDSANLLCNVQKNWTVLCEYNGTTTTVVTGPVYALAGAPYLTYTVSGTSVDIDVVGVASETYNCTATYQLTSGRF